jgi:hypothetical protein
MNTTLSEKDIQSLSWFIRKKKIDPTNLYNVITTDSLRNKHEDLYPQYYMLLDALQQYTSLEKSKKWCFINFSKKILTLNDSTSEIGKLRTNLFLLGDLPSNSGSNKYDSGMIMGINSFQQRH